MGLDLGILDSSIWSLVGVYWIRLFAHPSLFQPIWRCMDDNAVSLRWNLKTFAIHQLIIWVSIWDGIEYQQSTPYLIKCADKGWPCDTCLAFLTPFCEPELAKWVSDEHLGAYNTSYFSWDFYVSESIFVVANIFDDCRKLIRSHIW